MNTEKNTRLRKLLIPVMVIAFCAIIGQALGIFGKSTNQMMDDAEARIAGKENWEIFYDISGDIGAYLLCDPAGTDYEYRIYVKGDMSPGYLYEESGHYDPEDTEIGDRIALEVAAFSYGEKGNALISMNKKKVAKIEITNAEGETEVVECDSEKPFAVAVPSDAESVVLYDADGQEVEVSVIAR